MLDTRILRKRFAGLLAFTVLTSLAAAEVAAQPDFSGAWTTYRGNGGPGAAAPAIEIKLTAEAQAARKDFQSVTEGTNYGAGNACVGSGMPASMLGSGGYPMEIIQRPEQLFVIYEAHTEIRRLYIGDEAGDPTKFFPERNG